MGLEAGAPAPGQVCTIGYTEIKVSAHPTSKQWQAQYGGPSVTFTSFDGTRVTGTFEGTLDPVAGAPGPISVTKGTFSVLVRCFFFARHSASRRVDGGSPSFGS